MNFKGIRTASKQKHCPAFVGTVLLEDVCLCYFPCLLHGEGEASSKKEMGDILIPLNPLRRKDCYFFMQPSLVPVDPAVEYPS